jgi:hypothetical protein
MTAATITAPFVPAELRTLTRWVPWDLKPGKDSRPTKVPRGSTTDPKTWQTFDAALAVGADGVGFVFTDTAYTGVDLDGCLIDGQPTPEARQIIDGLASYTEKSPSGTGLHIIVKGKLPPGAGHKNVHVPGMKALEAYDTGRYFTWTGRVVEGREQIVEGADRLATLAGRWLGQRSDVRPLNDAEAQARLPIVNTHLTNDELLALIEQEQPTKYRHYVDGELEVGPGQSRDRSQEDVTLLRLLIPYTGWDESRLLVLAERSALKRERWAKPHAGLTWLTYQIRRELRAAAAAAKTEASAEPIRARTVADIWKDPDALKPPTPVIPRLAWRGYLTVYAAPDKAGKSTLVAAGVAALTTGQKFLDDEVMPGAAVWCLLEEHANTLAIRAKTFGTQGDRLAVFELRPSLEDVRREITDRHASVVVIDTLIEWAGALVTESSKAEQWRPVMGDLRTLARELNVAVIVLHHARKSDGVARDSSAITAAADVILEQKAQHADGVQRITARARWTVPDFAVQLVDGKRYALAAGTVTGPQAQAQGNRFKALDALAPDGMTFTAWEQAAALTASTFKRAAKALEASGDVQHVGELYKPRF